MKTISLFLSAFGDLFTRYMPRIKKRECFAFLVHPRDISDVYRKYPFLKILPDIMTECLLSNFWPVVLSEVNGIKDENTLNYIKGFVISIPITASEMMKNRDLAKRFIIKACVLAEKKGAKIIGLGALSASFSRGGLDLLPYTKSGITTGRIYTSKVIIDTTLSIIKKLGLKRDRVEVAIVGAAGSIGTACAQLLVKENFKNILLIDLSAKNDRIRMLIKNMVSLNENINIRQAHDISAVKNSDIIIAVTNRPEAVIKSENLKSGAVVVDDAQPSDIDKDIVLNRKDVLVLEGGLTRLNSIDLDFDFGLKDRKDIFSCLAEVMILSSLGHDGHFQIGEIVDIDYDAFDKINQQSEKMGFTLSNFQNFYKTYSDEDIRYVRDIIKK